MTDRVVLYNRQGIPLGEVDAVIVRSSALERKVRAERAVMQLQINTTTRFFTRFRNLVVVYSDVLPIWCGVIWDTRDWSDNEMTVTLYSCEYLLQFRRTGPADKLAGQPGQIFTELLKGAQQFDSLAIWIDPNKIAAGGLLTDKEYNRANVFDAVNDLAAEAEFYWWLEPMVSTANRLTLRAQWQKFRGVTYHRPLIQGSNFVDVKVTEICRVANRIYTSGKVEDWNTAIEYIAEDAQSRSEFGLIEDVSTDHDAITPGELVPIGKAELTKRKQPRVKITGRVIVAPYPNVGDNVIVSLSSDSLGYGSGGSVFAGSTAVRVKTVAHSPEEEGVTIMADNLYWEI